MFLFCICPYRAYTYMAVNNRYVYMYIFKQSNECIHRKSYFFSVSEEKKNRISLLCFLSYNSLMR